jgi:hypothetical protein
MKLGSSSNTDTKRQNLQWKRPRSMRQRTSRMSELKIKTVAVIFCMSKDLLITILLFQNVSLIKESAFGILIFMAPKTLKIMKPSAGHGVIAAI